MFEKYFFGKYFLEVNRKGILIKLMGCRSCCLRFVTSLGLVLLLLFWGQSRLI